MDPAVVCGRNGGVARTAQLRAAGVPRRRLRAAVDAGSVLRLREGVYGVPSAGEAVLHAARHGGRLACADALRWHGLWVLPDDRFHVAMQPHARFHEHVPCHADLVRHWDAPAAGLGHPVDVETALTQLSFCGTAEAFLVALESALQGRRPRVAAEGLDLVRDAAAADKRTALAFAVTTSESGLETLVRWRLAGLGIRCASQIEVAGVGRVDLAVGDRLLLELDGRAHHSTEDAFAADRRRDAAAAALGFVVLRFSYMQVMNAWPDVEAAILAMVGAGIHETMAGSRHRSGRTGEPVFPVVGDPLGPPGAAVPSAASRV